MENDININIHLLKTLRRGGGDRSQIEIENGIEIENDSDGN